MALHSHETQDVMLTVWYLFLEFNKEMNGSLVTAKIISCKYLMKYLIIKPNPKHLFSYSLRLFIFDIVTYYVISIIKRTF